MSETTLFFIIIFGEGVLIPSKPGMSETSIDENGDLVPQVLIPSKPGMSETLPLLALVWQGL